jgi:hypothetical protein
MGAWRCTDTYLRYEHAGDMHVGRTVTGLPVSDVAFALLPPHFNRDEEAVHLIHSSIESCFLGLPSCLFQVAEFVLASVVYHSDFLRAELDEHHLLFNTPLFAHDSMIEELKKHVKCGIESPHINATGIPPHVHLSREIQLVREALKKNNTILEGLGDDVASKVAKEVDETRGGISRNTLRETIALCLEECGISRSMEEVMQSNQTPEQITCFNNYSWSMLFANGIVLPMGSVVEAWQHWCCGKHDGNGGGYGPLRLMHPSAFRDKNMRKRFSDLKFVMRKIEYEAKRQGIFEPNLTIQSANGIFHQCEGVLNDVVNSTRRDRRVSQLSWITVATILRKAERKRRHDTEQSLISLLQLQST